MRLAEKAVKACLVTSFTFAFLVFPGPAKVWGDDLNFSLSSMDRRDRCNENEIECSYSQIRDFLTKACNTDRSRLNTPSIFPDWFKMKAKKVKRVHIDKLPASVVLPPDAVEDSSGGFGIGCLDLNGFPLQPVGMPITERMENIKIGSKNEKGALSYRTLASESLMSGETFKSKSGFKWLRPVTKIPDDYDYEYEAWVVHEAPHCTFQYKTSPSSALYSKVVRFNQSITTFIDQTPKKANPCSSNSITTRCEYNDGFWSLGVRREPYVYEECFDGCEQDGIDVLHSQSHQFYYSKTANNCDDVKENRTCNRGTLSGSAPYRECKRNCDLDGVHREHGSSATFYRTSVAYNCAQESLSRTCDNGTFTGDSAYATAICNTKVDCTGYWSGSCSGACGGTGVEAFIVTTNAQNGGASCPTVRSCTTEACPKMSDCTLTYRTDEATGTLELKHNESITMYAAENYYQTYRMDPKTCNSFSEVRTCNNGSVNGSLEFTSCSTIAWENPGSPLMVHMNSNTQIPEKLLFTPPHEGVDFDILGMNSKPIPYAPKRISWYTSSQYYFIVLADEHGEVKGIDQLFGNNTKGPDGQFASDGYKALAKYDGSTADGKNRILPADGYITREDPVFYKLSLWNDSNHNGIAEASELKSLAVMGVEWIDLNPDASYKEVDKWGNETTLKSLMKTSDGQLHLVFDVWFRYIEIKRGVAKK